MPSTGFVPFSRICVVFAVLWISRDQDCNNYAWIDTSCLVCLLLPHTHTVFFLGHAVLYTKPFDNNSAPLPAPVQANAGRGRRRLLAVSTPVVQALKLFRDLAIAKSQNENVALPTQLASHHPSSPPHHPFKMALRASTMKGCSVKSASVQQRAVVVRR